jgi:hypothetical protein
VPIYNNIIYEFEAISSVANNPAVKCEVYLGVPIQPNQIPILRFPIFNNKCWLNLKDYCQSFVNTKKYNDNNDYVPIAISQVYYQAEGFGSVASLSFRVTYQDNSFEYFDRILYAMPFAKNKNVLTDYFTNIGGFNLGVLHPRLKGQFPQIKIFDGYPFDFSFFSLYMTSDVLTSGHAIRNTVTGDLYEFLFLNNPFLDNLITGYINLLSGQFGQGIVLTNGRNDLFNFNVFVGNDLFFNLELIPYCEGGVYLKFMNSYGRFSYWLFDKGATTLTTKDLGELQNDFNNFETTISKTINIGVSAKESIALTTDVIDLQTKILIDDLFISPKIYLYTGTPGTQATANDFIEVQVKAGSFKTSRPKRDFIKYDFVIDLPELNTVTQ